MGWGGVAYKDWPRLPPRATSHYVVDRRYQMFFLKTSILELPWVKNCTSRLCTNLLGDNPPHTSFT